MLNIKVVSWALATSTAISFVVCVAYGLVTPETLHMHGFLEQVLPGLRRYEPIGHADNKRDRRTGGERPGNYLDV